MFKFNICLSYLGSIGVSTPQDENPGLESTDTSPINTFEETQHTRGSQRL